MKALTNNLTVRRDQGFEIYVLNNEDVEVAVVPELGAKIISLKNLRTGRDWMWHPAGGLKLFRNRPGDDFSKSPLVGLDECLPTIAPCDWRGRRLPDHGELWSAAWAVDRSAWGAGSLKTTVQLRVSPFELERTIELQDNEVRINYHLQSRSELDEQFLWAMHTLLKLQPADRMELPTSTRHLLNGEGWIDAPGSEMPVDGCSKVFAQPVEEGIAAIVNAESGDRLEFAWNPDENNTLGLWLTRGGWHGHHHFAVEPTNSDTDALDLAAGRKRCGVVPANGSATWQVRLRVGKSLEGE